MTPAAIQRFLFRVATFLLAGAAGGLAGLNAETPAAAPSPAPAVATASVATSSVNAPPGETARPVALGPAPAWVEDLPCDLKPGTVAAGAPGEILLTTSQSRLTPDGSDYYFRIVIRLLNAEGVRQNAEWSVVYAPEYEQVTWHTLRITRGDQVLDRLPGAQFKKLQRELGLEEKMMNGLTTAATVVDDVRVGDVIEVAYTTHNANPLLRGHMSSRNYLGAQYPIRRQTIVVHTPAKEPEPYASFLLPSGTRGLPGDLYRPAALRSALQTTEDGEQRVYRWEGADLPAIQFDRGVPAQASPYFPMLMVSSFRAWSQVVDWAVPVFASSAELPPEAQALVEKWRREGKTDAERLEAAVHWVQDEVRYFAMAVGDHNLRPRPLREVCASRYGDCKDKALLLATLLKELGLRAWPALVNTELRDHLAEHAPSPFAFNHAIVAYEFEGRLRWVDATIKGQRGKPGSWETPPYRQALLIREGETGLTAVPPRALIVPDTETTDTVTIDTATGDGALTTQVTLVGLEADFYRQALEATTPTEINTRWFNFISRFYKTLEEVQPLEIRDDPVHDQITLRAQYRLPEFLHAEHGRRSFETYAYALRALLDPPDSRRRHWPYALYGGRFVRHRITVELPFEADVAQQPAVVLADGIDFRVERGLSGRRFAAVHDLRFTADYVAADRMDKYTEAVDEALRGMSTGISEPAKAKDKTASDSTPATKE